MRLCAELGLDRDTYAVSIPLGSTINMGGAAVTISVLSLAAAHTLGIQVDFATAVILSVLSAISACGASGVAGGSLLLVPLACSLFGIPNDIAMQVVGVGFIVGVIQDSCETAINSSTDVLYTASGRAVPAPQAAQGGHAVHPGLSADGPQKKSKRAAHSRIKGPIRRIGPFACDGRAAGKYKILQTLFQGTIVFLRDLVYHKDQKDNRVTGRDRLCQIDR